MNIIVIGNGFDLAHELPTKYTDFLFFCKVIDCIIKDNRIEGKIPKKNEYYINWLNSCEELSFEEIKSINDYIYNVPPQNFHPTERDKKVYNEIIDNLIRKYILGIGKDQKIIKEVLYLIFDNVWIEYFLKHNMHGDENWIDFETEISNVVKHINKKMHDADCYLYDRVELQKKYYMEQLFMEKYGSVTYKKIRDKLEEDLNKLIRVFEIYLTKYVEKIDCKLVSPDIQRIISNKSMKKNNMPVYDTYVLSFNYTNTYQRLYIDKVQENEYCEKYMDYIHGKSDINNTIKTNNMVLGIDEYLSDDRKNKDIDFIAFKKYYQRIHKQTGCKYKEWVDDIRQSWESESEENKIEIKKCISRGNLKNNKIHKLYIFGHSLDVTDKDILRDLILNDNVYTTIFYHNKDVMGQQIANLVKIIGQDELIKRTGGSTKTIKFKQQKPMEPIDK